MRLLLNIEETKEIDLKLNFCDFYAVVSREKLEEALEITELPQTFMTVKEAVQTLKITERRVRLLISNGKLKNYAENLKREFLLDPKEVLAAEKTCVQDYEAKSSRIKQFRSILYQGERGEEMTSLISPKLRKKGNSENLKLQRLGRKLKAIKI